MAVEVKAVVTDRRALLGEGPHWEEETQTLLYVDIDSRLVSRWEAETGRVTHVDVGDKVGFVVPRSRGGYIMGVGRKFAHLDWDSQKVTFISDEVDEADRLNDGKCDPVGRLWAGSLAVFTSDLKRYGYLFRMDFSGTTSKQRSDVACSNGLAWTADRKTMFYIDSFTRKILAFDYNIDTGDISNERVLTDFNEIEPVSSLGFPDGMTIDVEDNIWVAFYGGQRVIRVDTKTGKLLQQVNMPAKNITSCCFGGRDYSDLYVTSASVRLNDDDLKAFPDSGCVFRVTGLGIRGLPPRKYEG